MWHALFKKKLYFVLPKEGTIVNRPDISPNSRKEILVRSGIDPTAAKKALEQVNPDRFGNDAVIDLKRLLTFIAQKNTTPSATAEYRRRLTMSRVKLQGTDGIRGKIQIGDFSYFEALSIYLRDGTIVPALFELAAYSLASLLLENGAINPKDTCTFGEDSRDVLTGGAFGKAVIRGFNQKGVKVYNTGVLATPGVIFWAAYAKSKIGAILTASHNPANQNGLKFIFDGFKLLEESSVGEFALTAMMYKLANSKQPGAPKIIFTKVHAEAEKLLIKANVENSWLQPGELKNVKVVYDGANGAYSRTAPQVLEELGIAHVAVNTNPLGHNINKGGGVAELEGTAFFDGKSHQERDNQYFPTVEKVFEIGRQNADQLVFGLINDGDGDRGYLLVYDLRNDCVWVLSGDELGIWILEGMHDRGELNSNSVFVASVESDLLVSVHAQFKLNLQTEIACVGDKWLLEPARQGKEFTVGVEESGHVTFACNIDNRVGRSVRVFTGNGVLSALRALAVINKRKADITQIINPFESGFKDSRSVYFADKSRFYPGSRVWHKDTELIRSRLRDQLKAPFSVKQITFENDFSMLYFAVINRADNLVAAIFVRNSGTENKTVVTIRGEKQFEELLTKTMLEIHHHHILAMKDMDSHEAIKESIVIKMLKKSPAPLAVLKSNLEKELICPLSQVDFDALIYAMRKQRFVTLENSLLHLNKAVKNI